jgi:Uma2 family endonuclease
MATVAIVPVEEYLRTTYHPDMEYVDGQLVERHVGEYFHSRMQLLVGGALLAREQERGFVAFTEQRVKVSDEPRYRIPDLCVKALPHEATSILVQPDLVIEIVSPDDSASEMLAKISDYRLARIPHIWIVDPYQKTVFNGIEQSLSGVVETELVGAIDFNPLFAQLDQRRR